MVSMKKQLLTLTAMAGLLSGAVSAMLLAQSNSATRPRPSAASAARSLSPQRNSGAPGQQTSCLDLPISSQLIVPTTCWQTGTSSMLVTGTSPRLAGAGAIAVLQGQQRRVSVVPDSGALSVVHLIGSEGCVQSKTGAYYPVNLDDGAVGSITSGECGASMPTPSAVSTAIQASRAVSGTPTPARFDASTLIPPHVSPSYYEETTYVSECGSGTTTSCPIYLQGQSTVTPSPSGIVVLDFGSPCSSGSTYGTEMFYGGGCVSDSTIHQVELVKK
jgi:hypothetical protein